jgi:peptidoglycan/LPS O-acetylase OafA/YrhL
MNAKNPPVGNLELRGHIPALDGVRGIAVLLVMIHHWTFLAGPSLIDTFIGHVARHSWIGVEVFFALSGFLITGILVDAKGKPHFFRNFYARRTLRIFPLYYAFLTLFLVIAPQFGAWRAATTQLADPPSQLWYWTYLSNFMLAQRGWYSILDVTWSLAIEEQFYVVWPMVVWLLSRKGLFRACLGILGFSILARLVTAQLGGSYLAVYLVTPCRIDGLALGALLALLARDGRLPALKRPLLTVAALGALCFVALSTFAILTDTDVRQIPFTQPFLYTAIACAGGGLVVLGALTAVPGSPASWLSGRFFLMLGKYSYSMYLFHRPVEKIIIRLFDFREAPTLGGSGLLWQLVFYGVCLALTLGIAVISWNAFEKQILKLKDRF